VPKRRVVVALAAGAAAVMALRPGTAGHQLLRRGTRWLGSRARNARGRLQGLRYRLARRHPDEDVPDAVLADRIRSVLGPVERRLDLPHIHVMVHDHVALLHGEVVTERDRQTLEREVRGVTGVRAVESRLRVGLLRSDTRPSEGRNRRQPSPARRRLEAAAEHAGATGDPARAVHAVLGCLCERIPPGERAQVRSHLPGDVRVLTEAPEGDGSAVAQIRTIEELIAAITGRDPDLGTAEARRVTEAVVGELVALVPEERDDVAATLPGELRDLWTRAG
jgi:uncharacterized protein (DUF2267 family)